MNSHAMSQQHLSTFAPSTSEPVELPLRVIVYMARFLSVADYRSFVKSIWPDEIPSKTVRTKLWRMSTRKITTKFINGEPIEIEYNYDPGRIEEERVLINTKYLLPISGGIVAPVPKTFTSLTRINNFIQSAAELNVCSGHEYACCPCHLKNFNRHSATAFAKPSATACASKHFHHYCSNHVNHWFNSFLNSVIRSQEGEEPFNEDEAEIRLFLLDNMIYFRDNEIKLRSSHLYRVL
nr:repeat element protein [Hyposoter didymator ichnovirus]